jgi:hypothetical protein
MRWMHGDAVVRCLSAPPTLSRPLRPPVGKSVFARTSSPPTTRPSSSTVSPTSTPSPCPPRSSSGPSANTKLSTFCPLSLILPPIPLLVLLPPPLTAAATSPGVGGSSHPPRKVCRKGWDGWCDGSPRSPLGRSGRRSSEKRRELCCDSLSSLLPPLYLLFQGRFYSGGEPDSLHQTAGGRVLDVEIVMRHRKRAG